MASLGQRISAVVVPSGRPGVWPPSGFGVFLGSVVTAAIITQDQESTGRSTIKPVGTNTSPAWQTDMVSCSVATS